MPTLYLIPVTIVDDALEYIPPIVPKRVVALDRFIVERARTARRFIKRIIPAFDIDACEFIELDKREPSNNIGLIEKMVGSNEDIGLMSESGTPCVADPGYRVVDYCRSKGYEISPLSGPSSIIMSLMASGFNGQQFVFHGYLPIKENDLKKKLKLIGERIRTEKYTHIFIETPYRNNALLKSICQCVSPTLRLCIASNISDEHESIRTFQIKSWQKQRITLAKEPAIFLLGI